MPTDIGARIGIDGESAFKSSLSAINSQLKTLGSEMKAVVSAFAGMEDSEEAVTAKGNLLQRSISASASKIEVLRGQSERAQKKLDDLAWELTSITAEFGRNSKEAMDAQNAYNKQVAVVNRLETQINQTTAEMKRMEREADSLGKETDDLTDGFDKAEANACRFWSNLKANVLGQAIVGGLKNLANAVRGMAGDFIESAAAVKAETSQFAQTFGDTGDDASAAIGRVAESSGILETRLNTLGAQIFAFARSSGGDAAQSMTLMEKALQAAADGAAYYDRSLEDTTESLQSFLKGNYSNDAALGLSCTETTRNAEAMELFGKKFNELSEIQKQETLLQMVLDAQELSGAMGQAAREADGWENVQGNLNEAWRQFQANVGAPLLESLIPVIQEITEGLTEMTAGVDWQSFSASITGFISAFIENGPEILSAIMGIGAGFAAWNVATMIQGISAAIKGQTLATTAAAGAQKAFNIVMNANPMVLIATLIAGVVAALVTFIATNEEARAKISAAWEQIKTFFKNAVDYFKVQIEETIEAFTNLPQKMKEIGRNVLDGFVNGIAEFFSDAKAKVSGFVDGIKNVFTGKSGFDTHSPSKWAQKVGGWVMQGLGIGIKQDGTAVNAARTTAQKVGDAVSSAVVGASEATQEENFLQITEGMQGQEPILTEYIEALKENLIALIESYYEDFRDVGEQMMAGVAEGIEDGRSGVVNAVARVIAAAVRRAREDLDINSPSKVFAEIGGYMAAGLDEGWQEKMKVASANISRSLAAVSAPPAAMGAAGISTTKTYTYGDINVHIDQISSEREAKTLAREIEFLRRQQDWGKGGS